MPKPEVTYYEGPGQLKKTTCRIYLVLVTNAVVSRDHNIFLGDLEFEGVDPLSLSEFENGLWENSRVSGEKEYYKNGKKLESSIPTDIVNYLDSNYDYIEAEKQFRELIADVSKPLEYKDDKSKGGSNKKKSFWGKRTRKEERKGSKSIDMGVSAADPNAPPPVVTPPPLNSKKATDLHTLSVSQAAQGVDNSAKSKFVYHTPIQNVGIEAPVPQGDWIAADKIKLYVVPVGVHYEGQYEVGVSEASEK